MQRLPDVAADRAAEATRRHFDQLLVTVLDKHPVEPDFTELVDHDRGIAEARILENARQQGGLSAAEETCQQRYRYGITIHILAYSGGFANHEKPEPI